MSTEHVREVLARWPGTPRPVYKLAAIILAEYAHREDGRCWPSQRTIAREAGCSLSYANRAVKALLAHPSGAFILEHQGGVFVTAEGRQEHRTNQYRVDLAALRAIPPLPDPKDRRERANARAVIADSPAVSGCTPVHPEPVDNSDFRVYPGSP